VVLRSQKYCISSIVALSVIMQIVYCNKTLILKTVEYEVSKAVIGVCIG